MGRPTLPTGSLGGHRPNSLPSEITGFIGVPFALLSPFIPGIGESLRSASTAKAWKPAKYLREVFAALFMWDFQGRKARHFFSRNKGFLDSLGLVLLPEIKGFAKKWVQLRPSPSSANDYSSAPIKARQFTPKVT